MLFLMTVVRYSSLMKKGKKITALPSIMIFTQLFTSGDSEGLDSTGEACTFLLFHTTKAEKYSFQSLCPILLGIKFLENSFNPDLRQGCWSATPLLI